jgi:hypothetical protein
MYTIFIRNWYRINKTTGQLEPDFKGRKTFLSRCSTEKIARSTCEWYNKNHKPGKLSRKAEYSNE